MCPVVKDLGRENASGPPMICDEVNWRSAPRLVPMGFAARDAAADFGRNRSASRGSPGPTADFWGYESPFASTPERSLRVIRLIRDSSLGDQVVTDGSSLKAL